jgi:homoserine O-acetyltransferase
MDSAELIKANSVGIVETNIARLPLPPEGFVLANGRSLPELEVAFETYGTPAPDKSNVVFICHALSGDAHVAGYHSPTDPKPGWWDEMVGPGKGIDTTRLYVVCANNLGGCMGTTGPSTIDPRTGKPYGAQFPDITIGDIVRVQLLLLQHLGFEHVHAVIGGSMGGMQVLEWSIRYPERVANCVCIASAASLSAQALSFDIVGRNAILNDPNWQGGNYYGTGRSPDLGLAQARMIGHITYLSPEIMTRKFGREKNEEMAVATRFNTLFQVESYLNYQGRKFVNRFDANSYLHISHAMDTYDLAEEHGSLERAFAGVRSRFLVIALSADWLFPPEQSLEIATALLHCGKQVSYCLLQAPYGHDAFLVDIRHLAEVVDTFLVSGLPDNAPAPAKPAPPAADEFLIATLVKPGARVLDLGCGDGRLLARLKQERAVTRALGIDIDLAHIAQALAKGLDVFQCDIDLGLDMIPDRTYDYVILSQTLQVVRKPRLVLQEMMRVATSGIVIIPNFAHWLNRVSLGFAGRMPKSPALPYEWYETPNIHLATIKDFVALCEAEGVAIEEMIGIPESWTGAALVKLGLPNLGADRVLFKVTRRPAPRAASETLPPGKTPHE